MNDITPITRDNLYKIIDEILAHAAQAKRTRTDSQAKLATQNCAYTDSFLGNPI